MGQLELWSRGWDVEPCDTVDPDEQAFTDLHGPQPEHRAYRTTVTVGAIDDYEPPKEQSLHRPTA